jgi:hypothetical protein
MSDMPPTSAPTEDPISSHCALAFTEGKCDTLFALRIVCTMLSLGGTIFIAATIVIHKTYRNFIQRMILWLTFSSFCKALPYVFTRDAETATDACVAQGFLMSLFDMTTLLWVVWITQSMWWALVYKKSTETWEKHYHAITWTAGLIVAIIPASQSGFGPAGVWCWITNEYQAMRFGLWYIPLYIILVGLIAANIYIFHTVNWRSKQWQGTYNPKIEEEKKFMKTIVSPLKWYPTIYVLTSIFPLINRIENWNNPKTDVFFLYVMHSVSTTSQGFLNALVYFAMTEKKTWQQCTYRGIKRSLQTRGTTVSDYTMTTELADGRDDGADSDDLDSDFEDIGLSGP